MPINTYLQNCRLLLQAFEDTQAKLLRLKTAEAIAEFRTEIRQLDQDFLKMHHEIGRRFDAGNRTAFLNLRQLERLRSFLKELRTHTDHLENMDRPDHTMIIFFVQRQYKFKQIFRRHLTDYARLS
jgi:hypothetical protein